MLCGLFYEAICFMSYLVLFCSCVFSPFSIAITSLGEERANLSAFRTFVRFALVWFCLFPLPLGVCEGLRFCGLFSYLLFYLFFFYIYVISSYVCDSDSCYSELFVLFRVIYAIPSYLCYSEIFMLLDLFLLSRVIYII